MLLASAREIPIFHQLRVEEALFRADNQNYCIAVHGSNPSIVMGAFGRAESLIDIEKLSQNPIPVIRRYSGGGTVVVDQDTFFLCFILESASFGIEPYPLSIMKWVFELIRPVFSPYNLLWVDNDFCLEVEGKLYKVAGNAQSISRGRVVHHISFPWSYQAELMQLLKMPTQRPAYRQNRSHNNFLFPLRQTSLTPEVFLNRLFQHLSQTFEAKICDYSQLESHLEKDHRKTTFLEKMFEVPVFNHG